MNQIEVIKKLFIEWEDFNESGEILGEDEGVQDRKLMFLTDGILGLVTHDNKLDVEFGKMILETLIQIKNKTTGEYIEDPQKYRDFIISCNFIESWLEWGTSIRRPWFNIGTKIYTSEPLTNAGYYEKDHLMLSEEFMGELIEFLQSDN